MKYIKLPIYEVDIKPEVWKEIYEPLDGDVEAILSELDNAGDCLPGNTRLGDCDWMYNQKQNLIYILDCGNAMAYVVRIKNLKEQ